MKEHDHQFDCTNEATIKNIVIQNVRNMIQKVIENSAIIRTLMVKKNIKIIGALHDLEKGIVTFL